jgi:hypothetical protein
VNRGDAIKAVKLFEKLDDVEAELIGFAEAGVFHIVHMGAFEKVPVESSIAKQIGYKYYNNLRDGIKQQLKDLGFEMGEETKKFICGVPLEGEGK